ncbi:MAG: hypothetical protein EOO45_08615 [Flavobacterium sp.]|nr:MAG: hypothetical protein EOO45_08615 [Flavobacterium sp.]
MKSLVVFLLLSVAGFAQNNFSISKDSLKWENVFISDEQNINTLIERHPRLAITSHKGKIFQGTGDGIKNTCPGTSALSDNPFSFDFEIELSDGKYRVTIVNIHFTKLKKGKTDHISAYQSFVNKDKIKTDRQSQKDLECLENYFNRIFSNTSVFKNKP